jgi:hypothetical protein
MFGKIAVLATALLAVVAVAVACGGGNSVPAADQSPQPVEGGLPSTFPDDFPMYPNLSIAESIPLGERYVVEAHSDDSVQDIVDFYRQELTKGRWELLGTENSTESNSTTFRFTAPGFSVDGRVMMAEDASGSARTIVGIAMPIEAGPGD